MKTVVHADSSETSKQSEVLGNIENLLTDEEIEVEQAALVINGNAVEMVKQGSEAAEFLDDFIERGVSVKVCSNSVENREIDRDQLLDGVEVVSSGIGELTRLQDQGHAYIRP